MGKTVLLVEDNADEILLARRAFAKAGLEVRLRIVEGGEQACRWLQAEEGESLPALVLLDWQMPGKDGLTVLRELRACACASLPVVVLSSSDEPGDIAAAYAAGANSYLRKPVDFDRFVQLVHDLCRYWLEHNLLPATRCQP